MSVHRAARPARPSGTNLGAGPQSDPQPDANRNRLPWPRPRRCNTSSCQCVTASAGARPTGPRAPQGPPLGAVGAQHVEGPEVTGCRLCSLLPPPNGTFPAPHRRSVHVSPPRVRVSWAKRSAGLGPWFWPFLWSLTLCGWSSGQGRGDVLRPDSRSWPWAPRPQAHPADASTPRRLQPPSGPSSGDPPPPRAWFLCLIKRQLSLPLALQQSAHTRSSPALTFTFSSL